eukprot:8310132-Pyramimonas_sp.AAC.1
MGRLASVAAGCSFAFHVTCQGSFHDSVVVGRRPMGRRVVAAVGAPRTDTEQTLANTPASTPNKRRANNERCACIVGPARGEVFDGVVGRGKPGCLVVRISMLVAGGTGGESEAAEEGVGGALHCKVAQGR